MQPWQPEVPSSPTTLGSHGSVLQDAACLQPGPMAGGCQEDKGRFSGQCRRSTVALLFVEKANF